MYDEYKAGRKGMPDELRAQMPVLKEMLKNLGIKTIEKEGWEADDILGTLAAVCRKNGDECFIATGDRDSLQLAHGGVKVLLARTKMGQAVTDIYDEKAIDEEYGVTPEELIQVKALQGDASDNIPGVAGVGAKTALDLIARFHNLDNIYNNLDELDIKPGVKAKLKNDKEKAYLSLKLGTISVDAPIDTDINSYVISGRDEQKAVSQFVRLELFSLIPKFDLDPNKAAEAEEEETIERNISLVSCDNAGTLLERVKGADVYFYPLIIDGSVTDLYFAFDNEIVVISPETQGYKDFICEFFEDESAKNTALTSKEASPFGMQIRC